MSYIRGMDIAKMKDELLRQRTILEEQIATNRQMIKSVNLKLRKLDTVLKHANEILNEDGTGEPSDDENSAEVRG